MALNITVKNHGNWMMDAFDSAFTTTSTTTTSTTTTTTTTTTAP